MEQYKQKLNNILLEEETIPNTGEYQNEIALSIYWKGLPENTEIDHPQKILLKFDIEIEFRSWGVKEITITTHGHTPITLELIDVNTDERKPYQIIVDLNKLQQETEAKRGMTTITGLDLYIINGQVDYNNSRLLIVT